ncbi:MAG: hypothetical protein ACK4RZ_18375, partial [Paracoccaceae bacterium]
MQKVIFIKGINERLDHPETIRHPQLRLYAIKLNQHRADVAGAYSRPFTSLGSSIRCKTTSVGAGPMQQARTVSFCEQQSSMKYLIMAPT